MSEVLFYERATPSFAASLAHRGHHIVYRANASNYCPGCGHSNWYIGRISAECGFCSTAVPLAEARVELAVGASRNAKRSPHAEERHHTRVPARGRTLQLLVNASPVSFALHNISEGGAMGASVLELRPGANVPVRFEGGILVPAVVKWAEDGMVGLAFDAPRTLGSLSKSAN